MDGYGVYEVIGGGGGGAEVEDAQMGVGGDGGEEGGGVWAECCAVGAAVCWESGYRLLAQGRPLNETC